METVFTSGLIHIWCSNDYLWQQSSVGVNVCVCVCVCVSVFIGFVDLNYSMKDQSDYMFLLCFCVYLIVCRQRGVVFVVVVGGDGLDLKFNAEVVAVGV